MTRAGIANVVDISKPTIADVFAELLDAGLVRQIGFAQGPRGPRAALYDLNHRAAWVVGIDVGRRWLRASIADLSGRIVARSDEPTDTSSQDALLAQIGRLAHEVADRHEVDWAANVAHVTIGSPGVPDPNSDAVVLAPNLPDWDRAGLLATLNEMFGDEIELENDVNLAALAELWEGHGRGCENFAYLWVGTGVGVGLILGGELHRGARGMAGEVAYLPLPSEPETGEAQRRGSFESAAAADAIVSMAERIGLSADGAEAVFELAQDGDTRALQVVGQEASILAVGLAAIVAIVDPELVIIGGGIGHNGEILLAPLRHELQRLTPFAPEVITSALGTDAVLRGAVGSALGAGWDHVLTVGGP